MAVTPMDTASSRKGGAKSDNNAHFATLIIICSVYCRCWPRSPDRLRSNRAELRRELALGPAPRIGVATGGCNSGKPAARSPRRRRAETLIWPTRRFGSRKHVRRVRYLHHNFLGTRGVHLSAIAKRAWPAHWPRT